MRDEHIAGSHSLASSLQTNNETHQSRMQCTHISHVAILVEWFVLYWSLMICFHFGWVFFHMGRWWSVSSDSSQSCSWFGCAWVSLASSGTEVRGPRLRGRFQQAPSTRRWFCAICTTWSMQRIRSMQVRTLQKRGTTRWPLCIVTFTPSLWLRLAVRFLYLMKCPRLNSLFGIIIRWQSTVPMHYSSFGLWRSQVSMYGLACGRRFGERRREVFFSTCHATRTMHCNSGIK